MGWRITVSILALLGSVAAAVIWLFLYSASFNIYENIVAAAMNSLVFIVVMAGTWASWDMKHATIPNGEKNKGVIAE